LAEQKKELVQFIKTEEKSKSGQEFNSWLFLSYYSGMKTDEK